MAKIRQTNEQKKALESIAAALKELKKLDGFLGEKVKGSSAFKASTAGKDQTVTIDIGETKVRKIVTDYCAQLADSIEKKASRYSITLDDDETLLCGKYRPQKRTDGGKNQEPAEEMPDESTGEDHENIEEEPVENGYQL